MQECGVTRCAFGAAPLLQHRRRGFAGDCVYATQRHFIDRLLDGKPFETSGEDYLITTAVQEAVYQSAARRAPVDISS